MDGGIILLGVGIVLLLLFVIAIVYSFNSKTTSTDTASGTSGPTAPASTPSYQDELSSYFSPGLASTPAPATPDASSDSSDVATAPVVAPDVPGVDDGIADEADASDTSPAPPVIVIAHAPAPVAAPVAPIKYSTAPAPISQVNTADPAAPKKGLYTTYAKVSKIRNHRCETPGAVLSSNKSFCLGPCPEGTALDGSNCVPTDPSTALVRPLGPKHIAVRNMDNPPVNKVPTNGIVGKINDQRLDVDSCKKACLDDPKCMAMSYNMMRFTCTTYTNWGRLEDTDPYTFTVTAGF